MKERISGHVPGYPDGSCFASRLELSQAGVHRPRIAGISGRGREGADSVVLAGGYENTQDFGNEIFYTGHGGRDSETGKQIGHQALTRGNSALATNKLLGLPARVVRGARHHSAFSPSVGYRYDGLYAVDDYWRERGRSGFRIWRFRLVKLPIVSTAEPHGTKEQKSDLATVHLGATILRLVHETGQTRQLKALYHYRCQMCGKRLETPAGPYAKPCISAHSVCRTMDLTHQITFYVSVRITTCCSRSEQWRLLTISLYWDKMVTCWLISVITSTSNICAIIGNTTGSILKDRKGGLIAYNYSLQLVGAHGCAPL